MAAHLLIYARKKACLTQRELAERSGIAQPAIARIERGLVSPRVETLERLLRACGARLTLEPERGYGVDRSAMRELLRLSPRERLELATVEGRRLDELERLVER